MPAPRLITEEEAALVWWRIVSRLTNRAEAEACWEWTGAVNSKGYGCVGVQKTGYLIHRVAYVRHKGPILPGLTIDHLCRNRRCANPLHLEAVTAGENTKRGESPSVVARRTMTCQQGHAIDGDNKRVRVNGKLVCRQCAADYNRQYRVDNRETYNAYHREKQRQYRAARKAAEDT